MGVPLHGSNPNPNPNTAQGESGWGCHFMDSRIGFHANAAGNEHFGKGGFGKNYLKKKKKAKFSINISARTTLR